MMMPSRPLPREASQTTSSLSREGFPLFPNMRPPAKPRGGEDSTPLAELLQLARHICALASSSSQRRVHTRFLFPPIFDQDLKFCKFSNTKVGDRSARVLSRIFAWRGSMCFKK